MLEGNVSAVHGFYFIVFSLVPCSMSFKVQVKYELFGFIPTPAGQEETNKILSVAARVVIDRVSLSCYGPNSKRWEGRLS